MRHITTVAGAHVEHLAAIHHGRTLCGRPHRHHPRPDRSHRRLLCRTCRRSHRATLGITDGR